MIFINFLCLFLLLLLLFSSPLERTAGTKSTLIQTLTHMHTHTKRTNETLQKLYNARYYYTYIYTCTYVNLKYEGDVKKMFWV